MRAARRTARAAIALLGAACGFSGQGSSAPKTADSTLVTGKTGSGGASGAGGVGAVASTGPGNGGGSSAAGSAGSSVTVEGGLRVLGNRLLAPSGKPFHGRGANLNDTRSCNACAYGPPDVQGLNRWSDELIDRWHANFVRFDLWSWPAAEGRVQWKAVTEDPAYLADVKHTVSHMTAKPGVYVMVTVFLDPSMKPDNGDFDSEWPTAKTLPVYRALAEAFFDNPKVLFGLTNEPHGPAERNGELAKRYVDAIDAIRAVEAGHKVPEHVVVVQAPQMWSRFLDYFVTNPIKRSGVAYEVHVYNPQKDFAALLTTPSKTLPIVVGEYGPNQYGTDSDIQALWTLCKSLEIPHLAWTFHMRCDPNLLEDKASDGCGLSATSGFNFPRTSWGNMLHDYLATPW